MAETRDLLHKLKAFCASRERSPAEVRARLEKLGAEPWQRDEIIQVLHLESFLDEERFCHAYIRRAHETRKIGRNLIIEELKNKEIGDSLIEKVLESVTGETQKTLIIEKILVELGKQSLPIEPEFIAKLIRKLARQGFEEEEILAVIRELSNIDI